MRRLFFGLVAAPVLFVASPAMADCVDQCHFISGVDTCAVQFTGGCSVDCTPVSVQAECDAMCTGTASVSCSTTCEDSCMTKCQVNPPSFDCQGSCETDCQADCSTTCQGNANVESCQTTCGADCTNRCQVECVAVPPSASCETSCQASCSAQCQVQENITCQDSCTVTATGGCTAACSEPGVAIFCGGSFVSESAFGDCYSCLVTEGLDVSVSTSTVCHAGTCSSTSSVSACSASPATGASDERWGMFGLTSLMVGLGLMASRKSRRGSR